MAYKSQDYVSKYAKELSDAQNQKNSLYNQINNFDKTYDHTKDAGWIAANDQILKSANISASNERGRMGNRTGTVSSWEDSVSASILNDANKNSQNLIPTYKEAALNKLNNQYSLLNNKYSDLVSLDQQDYNRWSDKNNFNYQNYLNDQNNRIALENAKAAQIKAQSEAQSKALEAQYKLAKLNEENGTNYTVDSNGKLYSPSKASQSFGKAIWSDKMFNSSANMKKRYGSYDNYVQQMIMLGYQRGNITKDDVNYLKQQYGF